MAVRCLLGHRWSLRGSQPFDYKGDWEWGHKTRFLYQCERCAGVKTVDKWGTWRIEDPE